MTKKDIVRTIAEELDLPQKEAKDLVQKTFDVLVDTLVREGRIELRNFGVFQIKQREARIGRNPRTGEEVPVMPKRVVVFKPGKRMEAKVQETFREWEESLLESADSTYDEMDDAVAKADACDDE